MKNYIHSTTNVKRIRYVCAFRNDEQRHEEVKCSWFSGAEAKVGDGVLFTLREAPTAKPDHAEQRERERAWRARWCARAGLSATLALGPTTA